MRVYYDQDADVDLTQSKSVAVIELGPQGHASALNLRESGVTNVIVGLRARSAGLGKAEAVGLSDEGG